MINEYEKFYSQIIIVGNSQGVIIPNNIIKGVGYEKGDKVIVMIKKQINTDDNEEQ